MEWAILRSATCCGPAPRMRLDTIVNIFCKQAWFDGEITVFGGDQWRSNVHVRDAAAAYRWLLAKAPSGETYNLTKENHTALALAKLVQHAMTRYTTREVRVEVEARPDARHYQMDAAKIRKAGFTPWKTPDDAARQNFQWFDAGHIKDPNADLYANTKRMAEFMKESV